MAVGSMTDNPFTHDPTDSRNIPGDAPGSFEQAKEAVERDDADGMGVVVTRHDPLLVVEIGNVTLGENLPKSVRTLVSALGMTFIEATDNNNLRCFYMGDLPAELQGGDPVIVTLGSEDGVNVIRLFDSGWTPVTGKHIAETPEDAKEVDSDALEKFLQSAGKI